MTRVRLRRLLRLDRFGKRLDEALDDEVNFHLETRIAQLMAEGRTAEEAREEASRRFGDPQMVLQRCRRIDQRVPRRRYGSPLTRAISTDSPLSLSMPASPPR